MQEPSLRLGDWEGGGAGSAAVVAAAQGPQPLVLGRGFAPRVERGGVLLPGKALLPRPAHGGASYSRFGFPVFPG